MTAEQPSNSTRQASTTRTHNLNKKTRLFLNTCFYVFDFIVNWGNPQQNPKIQQLTLSQIKAVS